MMFEEFWKRYPPIRKRSKAVALKSWEKLTEADRRDALGAVAIYAQSWLGSGRFSCMPSTWLNQRRWEDDPASWENPDVLAKKLNTVEF